MRRATKLTFTLLLGGTRTYGSWNNCVRNYNFNLHKRCFDNVKTNIFKNQFILINKFSKMSQVQDQPTALVFLAGGTEEIEFTTVVDVLRRGDVKVTIAGVDQENAIKCRNGIMINADKPISSAKDDAPYSIVILPGGLEAAKCMAQSELVGKFLRHQEQSDGLIAAICAAPIALKSHKIGFGKNVTCYPALADTLKKDYKYNPLKQVVIDGNLITSQGPATAMMFAFTILKKLQDRNVAQEVAKAMLYDYCEAAI